jgi:hypothetical protein
LEGEATIRLVVKHGPCGCVHGGRATSSIARGARAPPAPQTLDQRTSELTRRLAVGLKLDRLEAGCRGERLGPVDRCPLDARDRDRLALVEGIGQAAVGLGVTRSVTLSRRWTAASEHE